VPQQLLPRSVTALPPFFSEGEPPQDQEALIKEARRRQRRRRLILFATTLLATGAGLTVWQLAFSSSQQAKEAASSSSVTAPPTLTLHLIGWGTVIQGYVGTGSCPDGQTQVQIRGTAATTVGSVVECDLVVTKVDKPTWGVWSTHANMVATYTLPGGTIVTHEQRLFRFARDQLHTTGRFTGRILNGSGHFAHARGTVSGGGPGVGDKADWTVTFHFH
jgi:hypothetical protein